MTGQPTKLSAYERGDFAAALTLMRPLADQGLASAQFQLGIMYEKGRGVTQDDVQAHKWLDLAATRFPSGDPLRDAAISLRDGVAARMTQPRSSCALAASSNVPN